MSVSSESAAIGSMLGAACGDAAGAVLEFKTTISETDVDRALTMPGGGAFRVAPGQITDDSEMMICLARALANREDVPNWYRKWYASSPFDIGGTTSTAIASNFIHAPGRLQHLSKANGSLMRATPLGVLGATMKDWETVNFARSESALTHPNESCCDAVAAYALAIAHLIGFPGDRNRAFEAAHKWAMESACEEVKGWMEDARWYSPLDPKLPMGFVRIGFTLAFQHLLAGSSYEQAIRETLLFGGDTDTNAAIVGGLVGAAVGVEGIPDTMREAVLSCDTSKGRPRPDWLHPKCIPDLARKLLK